MTDLGLASISRSDYARKLWEKAWDNNEEEFPNRDTVDEALTLARESNDPVAVDWLEKLIPSRGNLGHTINIDT